MLTIPQRLPIKRMAMYGSTALLVGFTSTFALLREFAPKDSPSGVSVVETINKKPSTDSNGELDAKPAESQSTASVTTLPDQGALNVRNGSLPTQQYPRVSSTAPTYTAPASTNTSTAPAPAPVASTSVAGGSGSAPQQTTTQPSAQQPSSGSSTTAQPTLQETISGTLTLDLNNVRLP